MKMLVRCLCLVTLVAASTLWPNSARAGEPLYVGTRSCFQFACHGRASSEPGENWKSAYTIWATRDPHARAFDVLYSPRAERMFQLLTENDDVEKALSDCEKYLAFLRNRCVACHATPNGNEHVGAWSDGVSCESCHGAAGEWLTEHATSRWSEAERTNLERWGMLDTKSLAGRAKVCSECHIGPKIKSSATDKPIAVDHDLIAAGHPRLQFELNIYFSNLPPHWDVSQDVARHEKINGPRSFHFDTWRAGQWQSAIQLAENLASALSPRPNGRSGTIDFANFECAVCHHSLATRRSYTEYLPKAGRVPLRIAQAPFDGIQALHNSNKELTLDPLLREVRDLSPLAPQNADSNQRAQRCAAFARTLREAADRQTAQRRTAADRAQIILQLANQLDDRQGASWERALQFYFAIQSYLDDFPESQQGQQEKAPLRKHVADLFQHLDSRFKNVSTPTIYDSPDAFDLSDPEYQRLMLTIRSELKRQD